MARRLLFVLVLLVFLVTSAGSGCGSSESAADFPDVTDASATQDADGSWTISATISSPYDTPERYADAFRVQTIAGEELGVRVLTHDHANEQPFTRSVSGISIPSGVTEIVIQGRDLANGWGGATIRLDLAP